MPKTKNLIILFLSFAMITGYAFGEVSQKGMYENAVKIARGEIWQDINTGKCGSATVAIMVDGKVIYAEGFGMANREDGIPVDKDTIFNIGSISKVYVATAIMLLVDDGKVSLDKPVTDYLPEFKMPDKRYKNITVRMLLNHSSGLPGTEGTNSFGFKYNDKLQQETISTLARSHLKHNPGEMAPYCNDGFTLAEMIVERASGKKYIDFLKKRIFTPLGLKNTGLSVGEIKGKPVAAYYDAKTAKIYPLEVLSVLGAGALSSTPEDLCRFADAFSAESRLLKKQSLEEMKRLQPSAFWGKLKNFGLSFGLGWDITGLPRYETAEIQVLGKSGGTGNYSSMIYIVPDKRISVAVIASGAHSDAMKIALDILDAVLVEKKLIQKEEKTVSIPPEAQKLPKGYASFGGYYANDSECDQIVFDMEKNTVTLNKLKGEEKTPGLSLIYNNGYFYNKDGGRFYFTSIGGEDYFVCPFIGKTDVIGLQKVKLAEKPQSLKIDMNGKQWLRRNVYPFESVESAESHCVKSFLYKDLPGYVNFGGIKRIETPEFAGMPFNAIRDQTELTLFDKNGTTWAWVSDMLFSPADNAGALKAGENFVKIGSDGYNEWLVADEGMILGFTKPKTGRIIIFSPDSDNAVTYDSAIDTGDIYAAKGSFVEFAGYPSDLFTAKGRK